MVESQLALLYRGLVDLGYQDNIFTWNNGGPRDAFVQEQLDRAYATSEWSALFPDAKVAIIQSTYSDHNPIFITLSQLNQIGKKKKIPTRFERNGHTIQIVRG